MGCRMIRPRSTSVDNTRSSLRSSSCEGMLDGIPDSSDVTEHLDAQRSDKGGATGGASIANCDVNPLPVFACPHCGQNADAGSNPFQSIDLDKLKYCFAYRRQAVVHRWSCGCNSRWHLCDIHQYVPDHLRQGSPGQGVPCQQARTDR